MTHPFFENCALKKISIEKKFILNFMQVSPFFQLPNPHEGNFPSLGYLKNVPFKSEGFQNSFRKKLFVFNKFLHQIFFYCVSRFAQPPPRSGCTIFNHFRTLLPREFSFLGFKKSLFWKDFGYVNPLKEPP